MKCNKYKICLLMSPPYFVLAHCAGVLKHMLYLFFSTTHTRQRNSSLDIKIYSTLPKFVLFFLYLGDPTS